MTSTRMRTRTATPRTSAPAPAAPAAAPANRMGRKTKITLFVFAVLAALYALSMLTGANNASATSLVKDTVSHVSVSNEVRTDDAVVDAKVAVARAESAAAKANVDLATQRQDAAVAAYSSAPADNNDHEHDAMLDATDDLEEAVANATKADKALDKLTLRDV